MASDDSSSLNHHRQHHVQSVPQNGNSVLPGYVRFDGSKVKINLDSMSNLEIRQLKRKLVCELDQIRNLRKKLDSKEKFQSFNDKNNGIGNSGGGGGGGRIGATLARVNSEVSYVGPTNSRSVIRNIGGENVSKEKMKTPLNSSKKLKPCSGGGKKDGGGAGVKEDLVGFNKEMVKKCGDLLGKLTSHQYGWVFNEPVDVKKLKLRDYFKIIKHPMDLGTVKSRLSKNWYKSPKEFAEDVRLTFNNAMTYNTKGQDVHFMANVLLKLFEENWASVKEKVNSGDRGQMQSNARVPTPALKKALAPLASPSARGSASVPACVPSPAPAPPPVSSETRTLERSETLTDLVHSKKKATSNAVSQGRTSVSKKPKKNDTNELSYEEKQKLSIDLQSLPSEKLETVVQIIRKRHPGLFQHEDEIEVDIDSFDIETLWELQRFVTNYQKGLSNSERRAEVAVQEREAAGHNMHGIVRP